MSSDNLVKVHFALEQDADGWPPFASESVWAKQTSDGLFRIENVPFFVRGMSLGDEVRAAERDGALQFVETVVRSDHTTVRIIEVRKDDVPGIREPLGLLGCPSELGDLPACSIVAVDVPAAGDYRKVHALLDARREEGRFDYEESALRHDG